MAPAAITRSRGIVWVRQPPNPARSKATDHQMAAIRKPGEYKFTKPSMPKVPEIPAGIFSIIRCAGCLLHEGDKNKLKPGKKSPESRYPMTQLLK